MVVISIFILMRIIFWLIGLPDITAIDTLIRDFELQYSVEEDNPNIWKAFFRAHARYCTRCSICNDEMSGEKFQEISRLPGELSLSFYSIVDV